jgi:hypothetical protein
MRETYRMRPLWKGLNVVALFVVLGLFPNRPAHSSSPSIKDRNTVDHVDYTT